MDNMDNSAGPHRAVVPSHHLFTKGGCYFDLLEIVAVAPGTGVFPYFITFKNGTERRFSKDTGIEVIEALKIYYMR